MKVRSDSVLAQLTQEQLAMLYDWILASSSYQDAQARALKPAPDGFSLHIHITTLRRFYQNYTTWLRQQEQPDRIAAEPAQLISAAQNEIAHSIHSLAHSPANIAQLKIVTNFLQQQRETALKENFLDLARDQAAAARERIALERERMIEQRRQWEYNAARAALNHMPALIKIFQDATMDNEDKIWAAREVCFGKPPAPEPSASESISPAPSPEASLPPLSVQSESAKSASSAVDPLVLATAASRPDTL